MQYPRRNNYIPASVSQESSTKNLSLLIWLHIMYEMQFFQSQWNQGEHYDYDSLNKFFHLKTGIRPEQNKRTKYDFNARDCVQDNMKEKTQLAGSVPLHVLSICSISCPFNSSLYTTSMTGNTESFPVFSSKSSERVRNKVSLCVVGEGGLCGSFYHLFKIKREKAPLLCYG